MTRLLLIIVLSLVMPGYTIMTASSSLLEDLFQCVKADPNSVLFSDPSSSSAAQEKLGGGCSYAYIQQLVTSAEYIDNPSAHELLGLAEYFRGDMTQSYQQYQRCAELGGYTHAVQYCIFNSALLLLKRGEGRVDIDIGVVDANNDVSAEVKQKLHQQQQDQADYMHYFSLFSDAHALLSRVPEFDEPWISYVQLCMQWVEHKQWRNRESRGKGSDGDRITEEPTGVDLVINMIQSTLSLGLAFHPTCPGLAYAQGLICGERGEYRCARAYFRLSLHNRHLSRSSLFNSSYHETVCQMNIDKCSEIISATSVTATDGNVMGLDTDIEHDDRCFNLQELPLEYMTYVTVNNINGSSDTQISGSNEPRPYITEMFSLSKSLNTQYTKLRHWETFVRIHMHVIREHYLANGYLPGTFRPHSVFKGRLFHHYQQIGLSIYPKYYGLLFLQGLQYFDRENDLCAVFLFTKTRQMSELSFQGMDASFLEDIKTLTEELRGVALARLNNTATNTTTDTLLPPDQYSESRARRMCSPLGWHEGKNEQRTASNIRSGDITTYPTPTTTTADANLKSALATNSDIRGAHGIRQLVSKCNSALEPIGNVLRSVDYNSIEELLVPVSDNEFIASDRLTVFAECKVVEIGCNCEYCVRPGWVVVDGLEALTNHVVAEAHNMATAFADRSIDVLYVSHVFEHISRPMRASTLAEWHRVLVPGGLLLIGVPDMEAVAKILVGGGLSYKDKLTVMDVIYGGQETQWNVHYAGYFFESLREVLQEAQFCEVRRVDSFGLFNDSSEFDMDGRGLLSLNVIAARC